MDRKALSLRCYPEQYSTLLWPPAMCNHSCIRQELRCDTEQYSTLLWPPAMCNHSCIRQELACYTKRLPDKQSWHTVTIITKYNYASGRT